MREAFASDGVLALDIRLELARLDAPLVAATNLDRRQIARPHKGVRLHLGDAEELLNVGEGEESRGHPSILARTH